MKLPSSMSPSTSAYGKAAWGVSAMPVPCLSMKVVAVVALFAVVPVGVEVTVVVVMVYHPAVASGNATYPSPMTQP